MAEYRDFWREFRQIQDATKKKLLRKPNYDEAINHLRQLSNEMEEAEMPEHAAVCQREISTYYEKLQNFPAELQHLVKAAKLYHRARLVRHALHTCVMQESEALMEDCYLKAIEKAVKSGCIKLAAVTYVETAEHFITFGNDERAYHYFLKASRFAQSDIYLTSNILQKMCRIAEKISLESLDEILVEIQSIWSALLKEMPFSGAIREMLLKVECHIVLLNLKHVQFTKDFQRSILLQYNDSAHWKNLKLSVMTKDEFSVVSKFIASVNEKNFVEANRLLAFRLLGLLSPDAKDSATKIVQSIDNNRSVDRGFDEIRNSTDCNETEKRQKIFELYSGLLRKKQIKLDHL